MLSFPGVKYLHECPKEPKIPIYLLVGGCFGLLKLVCLLWKTVRSRRYERLDEFYDTEDDNGDVIMSRSSRFTDILLSLFLLIWFLIGNYWTLKIWKPHYKQLLHEPSNWCDKTVYLFAVGQIATSYVLLFLMISLFALIYLCHRFTSMFEKTR